MCCETFFVVIGLAAGILHRVRIFYDPVAAEDYAAELAEEMGLEAKDQNKKTGNFHTDYDDIWIERVDMETKEYED